MKRYINTTAILIGFTVLLRAQTSTKSYIMTETFLNDSRQELKLPLRVYYESVPPYGHKLVTKKNFLFNYPK